MEAVVEREQHESPPAPGDRILFESSLVTVGRFRAGLDDPWFRDSGPIRRPVFVFPRTSVEIEHEGDEPFTTDTCTVTYYNAGQRYTRSPVDPRGDLCDWFHVRPDVLRDLLASRDPSARDREGELFPVTHGRSDRATYGAQRLVVRHLQATDEPAATAVEEAILEILARLLDLLDLEPEAEEADSRESLTRRVRQVLVETYRDTLTLDEIADRVGISVYHMCREFRKETGITIHRYRNELRLRRSLELMTDGAYDLSRVAHELGYSSHSHFTATFRKAFGLTPSEFRRSVTSRRLRELAGGLIRQPCPS